MKPYNFKGIIKDPLNQNRELYNLETTNGETDKAMPIGSFGWVVALPTVGNNVVFTIENAGDSSNAICIGGVFDKSLNLDNDEYAYLPKDGKKIISIKNNGDINIMGGKIIIKGSEIDLGDEGGGNVLTANSIFQIPSGTVITQVSGGSGAPAVGTLNPNPINITISNPSKMVTAK